jgi:hypothetical protein
MSLFWLMGGLFRIDEDVERDLDIHMMNSQAEEEKLQKEIEELERLNKMPFFERLQQPSQIEVLKKIEEIQKETFMTHSVKKWNIPKDESLELFNEFFTEFLRGKVKSIYYFLKERGYKTNG